MNTKSKHPSAIFNSTKPNDSMVDMKKDKTIASTLIDKTRSASRSNPFLTSIFYNNSSSLLWRQWNAVTKTIGHSLTTAKLVENLEYIEKLDDCELNESLHMVKNNGQNGLDSFYDKEDDCWLQDFNETMAPYKALNLDDNQDPWDTEPVTKIIETILSENQKPVVNEMNDSPSKYMEMEKVTWNESTNDAKDFSSFAISSDLFNDEEIIRACENIYQDTVFPPQTNDDDLDHGDYGSPNVQQNMDAPIGPNPGSQPPPDLSKVKVRQKEGLGVGGSSSSPSSFNVRLRPVRRGKHTNVINSQESISNKENVTVNKKSKAEKFIDLAEKAKKKSISKFFNVEARDSLSCSYPLHSSSQNSSGSLKDFVVGSQTDEISYEKSSSDEIEGDVKLQETSSQHNDDMMKFYRNSLMSTQFDVFKTKRNTFGDTQPKFKLKYLPKIKEDSSSIEEKSQEEQASDDMYNKMEKWDEQNDDTDFFGEELPLGDHELSCLAAAEAILEDDYDEDIFDTEYDEDLIKNLDMQNMECQVGSMQREQINFS